jgi:ATP-binding cassette subfamily B protein
MASQEFTLAGAVAYRTDSPLAWLSSHLVRYPWLPVVVVLGTISTALLMALVPFLIGQAFDLILGGQAPLTNLGWLALWLLVIGLLRGLLQLVSAWTLELLAQRLERDTRAELFVSLLGKSQTFHNRQRVGDIMARATSDVKQINLMLNPGIGLILPSFITLVTTFAAIGLRWPVLLAIPGLYLIGFALTLRRYIGELAPVAGRLRLQYGQLSANLNETIQGIEVVKAYAQEANEQQRLSASARQYRDLFVEQGIIQGRYLPLLILGVTAGLAFAHALLLYLGGQLSIGEVITYLGLIGLLRFPTFISVFTFALVQMGLAGAERILSLITATTELDQNVGGLSQPIIGEIVFDNVSFGYGQTPLLVDLSFRARPGETIAIVGQTGAGKSTLTKLVNRTYDVSAGRVLIDGVDVRAWSLDALRSQISAIEQDIFLFSRSVADNIAFGAAGRATAVQIEQAAREAQAHDFIMALPDGYATVIGERGVTLSGGQRQRLAIARALLTDPRILILDDSTSAIDSATEDEIQRAMRRIMQGRTTLLITHRLSQIRWADRILVLRQGQLVDQGGHAQLLARCRLYQRIFARYEHQS